MTEFQNGKKTGEHGGGSPLEQVSRKGGIDVLEFVEPTRQKREEPERSFLDCVSLSEYNTSENRFSVPDYPQLNESGKPQDGIDVLDFMLPKEGGDGEKSGNDIPETVSPFQQEQPEGGPGYPDFSLMSAAEERRGGIDVLAFVSPLQHGQPEDDPIYSDRSSLPGTGERSVGIDVLYFVSPDEKAMLKAEHKKLESVWQADGQVESYAGSTEDISTAMAHRHTPDVEKEHDLPGEEEKSRCVAAIPPVHLKTETAAPKAGLISAGEVVRAEEAFATNFDVMPVCLHLFIDRKGEEIREKAVVDCRIYVNQRTHQMSINVKDIGSLAKLIIRTFPDAILDFEEKNAAKVMEAKFRSAMSMCPVEKVYFEAGWQLIADRHIYLRDGLQIGNGHQVETGMTLPELPYNAGTLRNIFQSAISMYAEPSVMSAMFAFSLMGVLFRPFREAGFAPRFTLFMYGKTGSMKTTLAKILYTQLCEDGCRDTVRRIDADTEVSLERAVVAAGYDTVTVMDDFSPAKTKGKKHEMDAKLEMVIRMVGDGSSRSRSNTKLEDKRGEGVQGMVALTGELMGKGLSSNLRCFYCRMEREQANEEAISWFQDNPAAFTTLVAAFADFVGENYSIVTGLVRKNFRPERKRLDKILRERRLIDSAVTLCLAADIFGNFLRMCCQMPDEEVSAVKAQMKAGIVECAKISEALSSEESPAITFVQAVAALMRMNKVVLNTDKVRMAEVSEYDGFEDDSFLYFNPDIIHKKVIAFLRQTNRFFPFELKEVLALLVDDGIIKTASNGAGKRTYCVRVVVGKGKKHNFLKISKTIFEAVCDGNYIGQKGEQA